MSRAQRLMVAGMIMALVGLPAGLAILRRRVF